jgi:hypothetical protein
MIPLLFLLGGLLGLMIYFSRKNVTWTATRGTSGSPAGAVFVFIIAAVVLFAVDWWLDWSLIPQYMIAVGGTLTLIAYAFFAGFALLCVSMFLSATKVGTMVA